jgi:hypothetical protein
MSSSDGGGNSSPAQHNTKHVSLNGTTKILYFFISRFHFVLKASILIVFFYICATLLELQVLQENLILFWSYLSFSAPYTVQPRPGKAKKINEKNNTVTKL